MKKNVLSALTIPIIIITLLAAFIVNIYVQKDATNAKLNRIDEINEHSRAYTEHDPDFAIILAHYALQMENQFIKSTLLEKITHPLDGTQYSQLFHCRAMTYTRLGLSYLIKEEYFQSFDTLRMARNEYVKLHDSMGIAATNNNIAILLKQQKNYSQAYVYLKAVIDYKMRQHSIDTPNLVLNYINMGEVLTELKKYDSAQLFLTLADTYEQACNDSSANERRDENLGTIQTNIGNNELAQEQYETALSHFNRAGILLNTSMDAYYEMKLNLAKSSYYKDIDAKSGLINAQITDTAVARALDVFTKSKDRQQQLNASKFLGMLYGKKSTFSNNFADSASYYYSYAINLSDTLLDSQIDKFATVADKEGNEIRIMLEEKREYEQTAKDFREELYIVAGISILIFMIFWKDEKNRKGNHLKFWQNVFNSVLTDIKTFWENIKNRKRGLAISWTIVIMISFELVSTLIETPISHYHYNKFIELTLQAIIGSLLGSIHHNMLEYINARQKRRNN